MPVRRLYSLFLCAIALTVSAAPLEDTSEVLLEKAERLRNARELPWDPATGRLGNLRHVNIVAPDCTVRVISGIDNRVYAGRLSVRIADSVRVRDRQASTGPVARDLTITATPAERAAAIPRIGDASGPVCFTLQVATPYSFIVGGDRLQVLFDRVELPVVDLFLNPSFGLKVWFRDVRLGALAVQSNASATAGGTGQVERMSLASSQGSTALLFHEMNARYIGVSSTAMDPRFSIRIGPRTEAMYHQPARAPGDLALHYPIWIDGPIDALKVPIGRVNPMPLTEAIREEARRLRVEVMISAGPMPQLPAADPAAKREAPAIPATVSPRQRVADALQPFLPGGVTLGKVDLWNHGGALEGSATGEDAVRQFVDKLKISGEVRSPQVAFMRREPGRVSYRILVIFMCEAPGEPSACPAGSGAYTAHQVEEALGPVLGPRVVLASVALREGGMVDIEGRATEVDANAALDRIKTRMPWLERSTSSVGNGGFWARLRMVCTMPQRADGICAAARP